MDETHRSKNGIYRENYIFTSLFDGNSVSQNVEKPEIFEKSAIFDNRPRVKFSKICEICKICKNLQKFAKICKNYRNLMKPSRNLQITNNGKLRLFLQIFNKKFEKIVKKQICFLGKTGSVYRCTFTCLMYFSRHFFFEKWRKLRFFPKQGNSKKRCNFPVPVREKNLKKCEKQMTNTRNFTCFYHVFTDTLITFQ